MTVTAWIAIALGTVAAWALATIGAITGFHWLAAHLAARRDALITRALEGPVDPWDYELRQLIDENTA
jgi:hypothetical protein